MRKHFIDHSNSSLHKLLVGGIFLFCISYITAQERKTETLQPGKIPVSQTDTLAVKEQKQDSIASPPSCTSYDYLKIRGITVPFPSICQTISPELFGSRKWLEDKGIGIHGYGQYALTYDVLDNEAVAQNYIGQEPTNTSYLFAYIQYDLGRIGLPEGSQLSFIPRWAYTDYYYASEKGLYNGGLSIYIPISPQVETMFGYVESFLPFYGTATGSSLSASPLGIVSSIPVQVGLGSYKPMPYADVKISTKDKKWYSKSAVARSLSPDGPFADFYMRDDHSFDWEVSGAKALVVEEVGYLRPASAETGYIWLRAGGIYNWSEYPVFDEPGKTDDNYSYYLVGDVQITQSPAIPALGWYVNFRTAFAPEDRNVYTRDFATTFYKIGTFANRYGDLFSMGISTSIFSGVSRDLLVANGVDAESTSTTISTSYAYMLYRGLYLNGSLSYTDNPSFVPASRNALNAAVNLSVIF